jgi:O-antigen/teichoic acid export membrane protein
MIMLLANKIRYLKNSKFLHNVSIIATGTAGTQAITIAFAPIITRLYGPEVLGLYGAFTSIVAVFTTIVTLSYPIAIVLPKEDSDAKGIILLSVYLSLCITTFTSLILWLGGDWFVEILGLQAITAFVFLIPLMMLFSAWQQIVQRWLMRKKQFKLMAKIAVAQTLIVNSAKTGIGWFNPAIMTLLIITILGSLLHTVMLLFSIKRPSKRKYVWQSQEPMWVIAKRYYDFPLYRTPQGFINVASQSLPVLMFASFFGPVAAGLYALGKIVMEVPSTLIGQSVGDAFYPRITEAVHNGEDITRLIIKATLALVVIGFLPFLLVVVFGPSLFGFAFGSEWVMAGEYARWLAPMLFFNLINKPSVASIPALGLQKGLLIYELFSTGTKLLAIYIGFVIFANDKIAIIMFSIFGMLAYIFLIAWVIISSTKKYTGKSI